MFIKIVRFYKEDRKSIHYITKNLVSLPPF